MKVPCILLTGALTVLFAVGCGKDNPVEPEHHIDEFTFELTMSPDHVSTLTEITFTLTARDHDGAITTDFESLQLERQAEGTTTWRAIDLTVQGNVYQGTYTFTSSGEYHFRVMGVVHAGHEMQELGHIGMHLQVERAHMDAGGYKVEYESFPGHIHEGESPLLKFWVKGDVTGDPVTGLNPSMRCAEQDGTMHEFASMESSAGVYEATHMVEMAGETKIGLLFTGLDAQPATAEFTVNVAHVH